VKIISLGFDNAIVVSQIVAVANASAAPMRRLKEEARKNNQLIDVTNGRRTRAIIVAESGHVILSSVQPQTLIQRIEQAG